MARALRSAAPALIVLLMWTRSGEASVMDWMQELSGPGPFTSRLALTTKICPSLLPGSPDPDTENTPRRRDQPCLYFDVHRLTTHDEAPDDPFGRVKVVTVEFGPTWRLWRAVDIGVGAGIIQFHSHGIETTRITIVAPRVEVKPILLFGPAGFWNSHPKVRKTASVLKLQARDFVIVGRLQAQDFGASPANVRFDVRNDRVTSAGLLFDLSELVYGGR
jgi:hypothetical protein